MIAPAKVPPPLDATLALYLMDVQRDDWGALLAPFCPPVPGRGEVILASLFGDVFLELGGGEIWWVNPQLTRVDSIAPSREAFVERTKTEYVAFLKTALVDALIRQDMLLKPGMLYGLKQPASEGGRWHPDNIGAAPIADAFAYWGDLFRRARALANAKAPALIRGGVRPDKQPKKGWFS